MTDPLPAPDPSLAGSPRPDHAKPLPRLPTQIRVPVPRSTFSTYAPFQPKCGHITMARVYHRGYRCERCGRHGPFGWLYRCTEHRELILDDLHRRGFTTAFDSLGEQFCEQMSLGQWGPDKRQDKYSVLREMSQEQMQTYTPQQLATILTQRENVWETAELQIRSPLGNRGRAPVRWSLGANPQVSPGNLFETIPDEVPPGRPWVPRMQEECTFKACHHCYRGAAEKAWLSLDGVLNGDIPPTAATAYSFHSFQARPVCKASVVATLGYRAVPLPPRFRYSQGVFDPTYSEIASQMQTINYHVDEDPADDDSEWVTTDDSSSCYLVSDDDDDDLRTRERLPIGTLRRLLPLHGQRGGLTASSGGRALTRSDTEAYTQHVEYSQYNAVDMSFLPAECIATTVLGPIGAVARLASTVPLPEPNLEEELFLAGIATAWAGASDYQLSEDRHFGSEPLQVPGSIAAREEAEEAGLAGIVTQV